MPLYLLDDILDQIDWECSIKLCQRGEPLLSSILIEAIKRDVTLADFVTKALEFYLVESSKTAKKDDKIEIS